jgi:HK97 family phage prohead protease
LEIDERGLAIGADLGGTTLGGQVYEEIKGGYTNKMSFGFRVGEDERTYTEDYENNVTTVMRTITKISKLYDVSAVSLPANDATEISARNYCDGVIAEIKAERLRAEQLKLEKRRLAIRARALTEGKKC